MPGSSESDLRTLYCAFAISYMLSDWSGVNIARAIDFISSCRVCKILPAKRCLTFFADLWRRIWSGAILRSARFVLAFFILINIMMSSAKVVRRTRPLLLYTLRLILHRCPLRLQSVKRPYIGSCRGKTNLVASAAGRTRRQMLVTAFGAAHPSRYSNNPILSPRFWQFLHY